ncbi:MAG: clan AA aspartic protease [Anaerolineae bacterium]|nr:clan AA aspartic protease [Anaerolineae bacterium]
MHGQVVAHHPLLKVGFQLPGQPGLSIEFAVDTGFVGYLTLPPTAVQMLNLPFLRRVTANLADDSVIHVSVHVATIHWDGQDQEVEVLATGVRPLLGTLLLHGYELNVQFTEGGLVSIENL